MHLVATLPDSAFLPAPLWVITVLHVLTLTLHLVAMNFLLGGLVVVLFGRFRSRGENPTVRLFARLFPVALAMAVTIGVAPLLFVQLVYGGEIYSASIVSGWLWILVPFVVIVAYYFLYGVAWDRTKGPGRVSWLVVALLGLLYVSIVYASVFSMAERPDVQTALYAKNQSGLLLNPHVGDWIPRWLHMVAGAVTVGGFWFGLLGRKNEESVRIGWRFFAGGFVLASILGVVYLLGLGEHLEPFMRSSGIHAVLAGFLLGLGALFLYHERRFAASAGLLFVSLLAMVTARQTLRLVVLEGRFDPASWAVRPQWGVFALFLVFFGVALAVIYWMLRLFFEDRPAPEA